MLNGPVYCSECTAELPRHLPSCGLSAATKSKADARALWADAVLDTWADSVRDEQRGHFSYQIDGRYVCAVKSGGYGHCGQYSGDSAPAARLAAAKKLYPDLPEAVRRELGECPT